MFEKIKKSLERLEIILKPSFIDADADGFLTALVGDCKEKYRTANGYDALSALNDTALEDWGDYTP